jgi:hypothetical protein
VVMVRSRPSSELPVQVKSEVGRHLHHHAAGGCRSLPYLRSDLRLPLRFRRLHQRGLQAFLRNRLLSGAVALHGAGRDAQLFGQGLRGLLRVRVEEFHLGCDTGDLAYSAVAYSSLHEGRW